MPLVNHQRGWLLPPSLELQSREKHRRSCASAYQQDLLVRLAPEEWVWAARYAEARPKASAMIAA
jgi:hypothetical protein